MLKKESIFKENYIDFFENKMWWDIEDILKYMNERKIEKVDFFVELLSYMKESYEENSSNQNKKRKIDNDVLKIQKEHHVNTDIFDEDIAFIISDAIRQNYIYFCDGGIIQAWEQIQAEEWYPRIIFKEKIEGFDIDTLPEEIILYRGTSQEEYDSESFGQAWSLKKSIAKKFAFEHYSRSTIHRDTKRMVLTAVIKKDKVLYYNTESQKDEEEVVIELDCITNVEILERGFIEKR